jgi:uncharacterized protein with GYD domain
MPKYLVQGSLSHSGLTGLMEEGGTRRHLVVKQAVESMGGTLEAYYFSFGHSDVMGLVDLPDNTTAAALAIAFAAGGAVSSLATTPLLTPEEIDAAVAKHPDYSPPGGVDG